MLSRRRLVLALCAALALTAAPSASSGAAGGPDAADERAIADAAQRERRPRDPRARREARRQEREERRREREERRRGAQPPAADTQRFPAKMRVLRAGVKNGRLDVLAEITKRATGTLQGTFQARGTTMRFTATIGANGQIRVDQRLGRSQRGATSGIVQLSYPGNDAVRPDEVRLRAASGKAALKRGTTRIQGGTLEVHGTVNRRARGVVRIRLDYVDPAAGAASLNFTARIAGGAWKLAEALPPAAQGGGQLSIQFTGYGPADIRGEQLAKEVRP